MINFFVPLDYECLINELILLVEKITKNQDICKLLYYNNEEPFQSPTLTSEEIEKIFTEKNLIEITPRIKAREEQTTYLMLSFDYMEPTLENPKFMNSILIIDIISHIDLWKIQNKLSNQTTLRPYAIAHELHSMINEKKFTGIGTAHWIGTQNLIMGLDSEYAGLTMKFDFVNSI